MTDYFLIVYLMRRGSVYSEIKCGAGIRVEQVSPLVLLYYSLPVVAITEGMGRNIFSSGVLEPSCFSFIKPFAVLL
jgi:hypothetical protein